MPFSKKIDLQCSVSDLLVYVPTPCSLYVGRTHSADSVSLVWSLFLFLEGWLIPLFLTFRLYLNLITSQKPLTLGFRVLICVSSAKISHKVTSVWTGRGSHSQEERWNPNFVCSEFPPCHWKWKRTSRRMGFCFRGFYFTPSRSSCMNPSQPVTCPTFHVSKSQELWNQYQFVENNSTSSTLQVDYHSFQMHV